ncbi:hypothetical protein HKBW3S03_01723, partial [Candidatus Hakubella thermalkaliphila]
MVCKIALQLNSYLYSLHHFRYLPVASKLMLFFLKLRILLVGFVRKVRDGTGLRSYPWG